MSRHEPSTPRIASEHPNHSPTRGTLCVVHYITALFVASCFLSCLKCNSCYYFRFTSEADLLAHIDTAANAEQTEPKAKNTTTDTKNETATEKAENTSKDKVIEGDNKDAEVEALENEVAKCSRLNICLCF